MSVSALPTQALLAAIERALNSYLRLDPESAARLAALSDKVVAIDLKGLDWKLYLLFGSSRLQLRSQYEYTPDVQLRGTPLALMRLAMDSGGNSAAKAAMFSGTVEISGDTDVAQRFSALLAGMDIDWEELLSKFTGDLLAHKLGNAARATQNWAAQRAEVFGQNFSEYQTEEARNLPAFNEAASFYREVDELRDDVERLEQRVRRLQNWLKARPAAADTSAIVEGSAPESIPGSDA